MKRILLNGIETVKLIDTDSNYELVLKSQCSITEYPQDYQINYQSYDLVGELFKNMSINDCRALTQRHVDDVPQNLPFELNGFFSLNEIDSLSSALFHLKNYTFHVDSVIWENFYKNRIIPDAIIVKYNGQNRKCDFISRHPLKHHFVVGWQDFPECYLMSINTQYNQIFNCLLYTSDAADD